MIYLIVKETLKEKKLMQINLNIDIKQRTKIKKVHNKCYKNCGKTNKTMLKSSLGYAAALKLLGRTCRLFGIHNVIGISLRNYPERILGLQKKKIFYFQCLSFSLLDRHNILKDLKDLQKGFRPSYKALAPSKRTLRPKAPPLLASRSLQKPP